ncbi:unnamed protein product [Moneuplotes crassus]|uniref:Uncharacterized protein n=1 Tax=Euplotes crassus TaxID=5936 RepID=A0AAD1XXF8_EUPCR|nr:unnamed protein product [Moneuplotes crassus]
MRKRILASLLAIIIYRSGNFSQLGNEIINIFEQHKALGFLSATIIILSYLKRNGYLKSLQDSQKLLIVISKILWNEIRLTKPINPIKIPKNALKLHLTSTDRQMLKYKLLLQKSKNATKTRLKHLKSRSSTPSLLIPHSSKKIPLPRNLPPTIHRSISPPKIPKIPLKNLKFLI